LIYDVKITKESGLVSPKLVVPPIMKDSNPPQDVSILFRQEQSSLTVLEKGVFLWVEIIKTAGDQRRNPLRAITIELKRKVNKLL
jgi:hypothetical protein